MQQEIIDSQKNLENLSSGILFSG